MKTCNGSNWLDNLTKSEVERYINLVLNFRTTDVRNRNFNRACNGYFHNRGKNLTLDNLNKYYKLLENYKKQQYIPDYQTILHDVYKKTEVFAPTLASQAMHLLDNNLPVFSAPALKNAKMIKPNYPYLSVKERIERATKTYSDYTNFIREFRDTYGDKIIADFKAFAKRLNIQGVETITDTKIIDFYFWKK
jgi:hypothetical protein